MPHSITLSLSPLRDLGASWMTKFTAQIALTWISPPNVRIERREAPSCTQCTKRVSPVTAYVRVRSAVWMRDFLGSAGADADVLCADEFSEA